MPQLIRYALDPTGKNLNNLISNEVHQLAATSTRIRSVAPIHGAFFKEGLVVKDHTTGNVLTIGTDYQCVEMLQEATLKYGKEVVLLILIINPDVSGEVRLQYQTLGGLYQQDGALLKNIYDKATTGGDGPVDWADVLNKPDGFNPALHNHLLSDVFGFEALVVSLERLRNAIVLSHIPAFDALIEWVKAYVAHNGGGGGGGGQEPLNIIPVSGDFTFDNNLQLNSLLDCDSFDPINIIVTSNEFYALPIGFNILIRRRNEGSVTITTDPYDESVLINSPSSFNIGAMNGIAVLIKISEDEWVLEGNLEGEGGGLLNIVNVTSDFTVDDTLRSNSVLSCNSANDITIYITDQSINNFNIGFSFLVRRKGTGRVTLGLGPYGNAVLLSPDTLSIGAVNGMIAVILMEENEWAIEGNLEIAV